MRLGRAIQTILLFVTLLTAGAASWAVVPSTEARVEIEHLLAFVAKAATKSSTTDRPYTVRCGSEPTIASDEWLMAELMRFRLGR